MLALIGVLTIVIMLVLIMTKKLQTLLALIIVPIIGCLVAGFTGNIVLEEGVFTVDHGRIYYSRFKEHRSDRRYVYLCNFILWNPYRCRNL